MTPKHCEHCRKDFTGLNYGVTFMEKGRSVVVDLCSTKCRRSYRRPVQDPKPIARSRNAETGVGRGKRKKSAAEIRRDAGPKERDVSASIASFLDGRRVWNTRTQSGAIRTASGHSMQLCRRGTPDRIAADGLHVWIEVKRPGEQASPEQLKILEVLKSAGALGFVVDDPLDMFEIFEGLKRNAVSIDQINDVVGQIQREIEHAISKRKEQNNGTQN